MQDCLALKTDQAKEALEEGFLAWPKSLQEAKDRARLFKSLQQQVASPGIESPLTSLSETIQTLQPLLRDSTETEKEGYGQVCFRGSPWSQLNSIPFALSFLSFYKSYLVPASGVLMPFIAFLLPFILMKTFFRIPISFSAYASILWRMWNGQPLPKRPEDFLLPPPEVPTDLFTRLKQLGQNGWTLFTLGQSVYHPIQQARHFRKLDAECLRLGEAIVRVRGIASEASLSWAAYLPHWFEKWIGICPTGAREAFAFVMDNPFWLRHLLRGLGRFEVLWALASRSDICVAEFIQTKKPTILLKGFGDPAISSDRRVLSNLKLNKHTIVTGPNRGGKSSFMRGVLLNVKLAHCFGCCFAEKAQMSHFTWIADGMRLADSPGKESMFEREVAFAAGVLKKATDASGGFGLVLYDELFHSTNPPDAKRTSELFTEKLWKEEKCLSILSTHIYSLAHQAPSDKVKKICLASWKKPNGKYVFSYKAKNGICEVSSVDLLLKQFGLVTQTTTTAFAPQSL